MISHDKHHPPQSPPSRSNRALNWAGGLLNNPQTGKLSHAKLWANVAAAAMTWQFSAGDAPEWQWWAYGGMVGGYGLARRAIAAVQQVSENKQKE